MKLKTWAPLVLAVALGLVAAKVARDSIARNHSGSASGKSVKVVVAKGNIVPGQTLTPEMLTVAAIGSDSVPANAFTNPADLTGRVPLVGMFKGQPIVNDLLATKGTVNGLQAMIPDGKRAITVQVDEVSGVAGLLVPGCHVDVVATVSDADSDFTAARTIVQNVMVSAVGQRTTAVKPDPEKGPEITRSVTLIASPREVESIELVSSNSRPRLVLRSSSDQTVTESTGITLAQMRRKSSTRVDPFTSVLTQYVAPATRPAETQPSRADSQEDAQPVKTAALPQPWHVTLINNGVQTDAIFEEQIRPSQRTVTATVNPSEAGN